MSIEWDNRLDEVRYELNEYLGTKKDLNVGCISIVCVHAPSNTYDANLIGRDYVGDSTEFRYIIQFPSEGIPPMISGGAFGQLSKYTSDVDAVFYEFMERYFLTEHQYRIILA